MFECVVNVSEGRDPALLEALTRACGPRLRDRHRDRHHHRSVFTLIDEPDELMSSVRTLAAAAYQRIDLRRHEGVHPRFGVVDVVPFVALGDETAEAACALRDVAAAWFAEDQAVPVFLYGPLADGSTRTLPEVRRDAFSTLAPDLGPAEASESRGAVAVGCRPVLVAWNLWLTGSTPERARELAAEVRSESVRALGLEVGVDVQVSCNLVDPAATRPSQVYDSVAQRLAPGEAIDHAELVGLAPRSVVEAEDPARLDELGLSEGATIEARLGL